MPKTELYPTWMESTKIYLDENPPSYGIIAEVTSRLMNINYLRRIVRKELEGFLSRNHDNIYLIPNNYEEEQKQNKGYYQQTDF